MKKYIGIAVILLISIAGSAQIQRTVVKQKTDTVSSEPVAEKTRGERKEIFKELNLTREQKIKMKDLNQFMKASKDEIDNDASLTEEQKKEKLRALRKAQITKIQGILTEEQKIKYRQLKAKSNENG